MFRPVAQQGPRLRQNGEIALQLGKLGRSWKNDQAMYNKDNCYRTLLDHISMVVPGILDGVIDLEAL